MNIAGFDSQAASIRGSLRARFERQGNPLAPVDLEIAVIALAHDLMLIGGNGRHSELELENWLE